MPPPSLTMHLRLLQLLLVWWLALAGLAPLCADPAPSLDRLDVLDQSTHLTLLWHLYPKELPAHFNLPGSGETMTLDDSASLKQNVDKLARAAYRVTVDARPTVLQALDITLAPDGGCLVTLVYPGHRGAAVELQANLMPIYPSSYLMNYSIYSPSHRSEGTTGYLVGGGSAGIIRYRQIHSSASEDTSFIDPRFAAAFKSQLRTPWVNSNWIILSVILLLVRGLPVALGMMVFLLAEWTLAAFLPSLPPNRMGSVLAGLTTALVCVLAANRRSSITIWLLLAVGLAGALNAASDQAERGSFASDGAALGGVAGFVSSLSAIVLIAGVLLHECRKYPHFQASWAPRLAGALALLALILIVR